MPNQKTFLRDTSLLALVVPLFCVGFLLSPKAVAQSLDETEKLFLQGEYEEVVRVAKKNVEFGGINPWRTLLIKSLLATGRYDEAQTNVTAAFSGYYSNIRLLLLARETALFQNDLAAADRRLAEIKSLIERRSSYDSGENLVAIGEALLLLGVEPRLVLENCFRRAEKMTPPPREAFLASGKLALDKHDFALAADTFRAGLKKLPGDADLLGGLAQAFAPGNRQEMLKNIEAALTINPRHTPSLLLLIDHLIDAEQYSEAQKQLVAVLKINPHQPEALAYRAVLAHLRNDFDKEKEYRAAGLKFWKTNPQVDHLIGLKLSQKYRFEEGAAAQKQALILQPDFLPARRQLAQDLLRLGKNDEGWKIAEAVHKQDAYDVTSFNLSNLHDQMAKFQTLSNADFIVRMSPLEAQVYGDRVLELLDRAKKTLSAKYGFELSGPITVEIFPEQKDFAVRTFGMPGNPGYLGVCFGSVITANSPASQAPNPANWEAVLWHEFVHVITLNATKNRMPRWLSEGISVYEERQANPLWGEKLNVDYREMILEDDLTPLSKLSSAFLTPKNGQHLQFAYYESSLVVEFIVQKFGFEKLKNILRDLREGGEINQTMAKHTVALPELEKQFDDFARDIAKKFGEGADLEKPPRKGGDYAIWEQLHSKNYYVRMKKVEELMLTKQWEEAKTLLESLAEKYHGESGVENPLWQLAIVYRNLNQTNAERTTLEKLASQESDFVDLFSRLIELAEARKNWAAVSQYAERLLAINPLITLPHRALAEAGAALGKNDQTIMGYRKMLLLDPPDPAEAHFQLARLLHARGDAKAEAKRHVLQSLEEAPRFRKAQRLLLEISGEIVQPEESAATSKVTATP